MKPKKLSAGSSLERAPKEKSDKEVEVAQKQTQKKRNFIVVGLHNLKIKRKRKKILGRGPSSGHGKTSTRGSKGQTSRSGRDFYLGFEGGQTPLIRRIPKRGFRNPFKKEYQIVNLKDLAKLKDQIITPEILEKAGLIKDKDKLVKVLGEGELERAVTIQAHAFSSSAQEKLERLGCKLEVLHASGAG